VSAAGRTEPELGDIDIPIEKPRRRFVRLNDSYDFISLGCFLVSLLSVLVGIAIIVLGAGVGAAFGASGFGLIWGLIAALGSFSTALIFLWMGNVHHNLRLLVELGKRA
jgi:hypothetical protein